MPASAVDPGIDNEGEHEEVESAAHEHAGEEGHHELEPVHRAPAGLTARTYPVGGTGSRCGSHQRAVMREASGDGRRIPIRPGCYAAEARRALLYGRRLPIHVLAPLTRLLSLDCGCGDGDVAAHLPARELGDTVDCALHVRR